MMNRTFIGGIVGWVGLVFLTGPQGEAEACEPPLEFQDQSSLLSFYRVSDPVSVGLGGAGWLDYDDDGDLDLFLANAPGGDHALYRNDGGSFVDVATLAGVTGDGSGHTGVLAGDIDNDDCTDLFLTGAGAMGGAGLPHRLYLNNCDGTFTDATAGSGIDPTHLGMMAAFGDIDLDGYIDLFVTSPGSFFSGTQTTQKLYHNDGDGTFTDISAAAGIDTALGGCVVGFTHYDDDIYPDIMVGNCNMLDNTGPQPMPTIGPWELWRNLGDLTFEDVAGVAGLDARPGFPMAMTMADYDGDGDMDAFATGMGPANPFSPGLLGEQVLFENNGDGTYCDATYAAGLGGFEWGWGASFADFDNDGDEDLASVGSMAKVMPFLGELATPGRIFRNDGLGGMTPIIDFGLGTDYTSGLAVADYDNDGFSDLVIVRTEYEFPTEAGLFSGGGSAVLKRNAGNDNHWLKVGLKGTFSNAMGIGATVAVDYAHKAMAAGSSFASTDSPWMLFGRGSDDGDVNVCVEWPSGLLEVFTGVDVDQAVTLQEGTGDLALWLGWTLRLRCAWFGDYLWS